ncbi:MAG: YggU family protein [Chloroflexi bacterium]|nr:YggU family protein [Chloroflexota bacterium]
MRRYDDFNITDASGGAALTVKIVPLANRTEIVGIQEDGTLKVRLMSAPVDGQANEELIMFLAEFFGCKPEEIEIVAGQDSRKKLISLTNVDPAEVDRLIRETVPDDPDTD